MSRLLISRLHAVRRKHLLVVIARALVAALAAVVLCLAAEMCLDRWLELAYPVRCIALAVTVLIVAGLLFWQGFLPLINSPDVEQAALWVERDEPSLASRLISVIQLTHAQLALEGISPVLLRELVAETETLSQPIDFKRTVRTDGLVRLGMTSLVVIGVVAVGSIYAGAQSVPLLKRALLVPNIDMPRRTQIDCITQNLTIARGESVTLTARCDGVIPTAGTLKVHYDSNSQVSLPLTPAAGRPDSFVCHIDNVQESFSYTMILGDNQTPAYRINAVVRPSVVNLKCTQIFPRYTHLGPVAKSPWDLSLLDGSRLAIDIQANKPIKPSLDIHENRIHFIGSEASFALRADINDLTRLHAVDTGAADIPVPPGTTGFSIELTDTDGIKSKDDVVYRIDPVADRPPTVRILAPAEKKQTVAPLARPRITLSAEDDFAVGSMALLYRITKAGQTTAAQDDPNGINATYFPNPDLTGDGAARVEPALDCDWTAGTRLPGIADHFSVRFTGQIRPVYSDKYRFKCLTGDGVRIWVDNKQLVDRWPHNAVNAEGPDIFLQAGHLYPITVEARIDTGDPIFRLGWWSPHQRAEVIPHTALFHRADNAPAVPPAADGLVGYWTMDDDNEGFVHDSVASAVGTVYNASRAPGRIGRAVSFAGVDQRVEIPATEAMNFHADDSFSLCAWINLRQTSNAWQGVVTKSRDGGNWYGIWIGPSNHFDAPYNSGVMEAGLATPGWHDVVLVQNAATRKRTLYMDGVGYGSGPAADATSWGDLVIGGTHGTVEPFNGLVDDVRLYARALSPEEIADQYNHPQAVAVLSAAELAGVGGAPADRVPIDIGTDYPKKIQRQITLDLTKLSSPIAAGDRIEFWAQAADTNNITGPGVGVSEHHSFRVITEDEKQRELMEKLGDYMGQVRDVSESERDLNAKTGTMVRPGSTPPATPSR